MTAMICRRLLAPTLLFAALPLFASDAFEPKELAVSVSSGKTNNTSRHGFATFQSIHFEVTGPSPWLQRRVPGVITGFSLTYSDIEQAHSWFGYQFENTADRVRGQVAQAFLRYPMARSSAVRPYVELGTGPMWSNRRVPAATSRLNFNSYLVLGVSTLESRSVPLRFGYRFAHVSNGGIEPRNPGWNIHSFFVGTRLKSFGKR